MEKENKLCDNCYNCKYRWYNKETKQTECYVSKKDINVNYDSIKNLLYTKYCPLKKLSEDEEFIYWN